MCVLDLGKRDVLYARKRRPLDPSTKSTSVLAAWRDFQIMADLEMVNNKVKNYIL
jgi:hypothetical protein